MLFGWLRQKRPSNSESDIAVPTSGVDPVADRGTKVSRIAAAAPGTTPQAAPDAWFRPCAAIAWRTVVIPMPAIFQPLPDITDRVMHAKRICAVGSYRGSTL